MKETAIVLMAATALAFGQSGHITGTILDDSGAPIQGASVAAALWSSPQPLTLVPGKPPAFLPVAATSLSGLKGEFTIDVLNVGKYYICVEKPDAAILNPCLWADPPVAVDVAAGATVAGVKVVAVRGVAVNVRVQDAKGLMSSNPAQDDVMIGTYHRAAPFIPGRITARDPAGKTVTLVVPRGQPATISTSSSAFELSDDKGAAVSSAGIAVSGAATAATSATPVTTVNVTGTKPPKP